MGTENRELTRLTDEQAEAFGDRLDKAIWIDRQSQVFRCSGRAKTITRQVLKDLGCTAQQIEDFLVYAESQGGLCCDCEIGFNMCGGDDDSKLEVHHDLKARPNSLHSLLDVHTIHKSCHRAEVGCSH